MVLDVLVKMDAGTQVENIRRVAGRCPSEETVSSTIRPTHQVHPTGQMGDELMVVGRVDSKARQLVVNRFNEESGDELLESDEEAELNRIGNVPLEWYDEFEHTGYDSLGRKIIRNVRESEIDQLLASAGSNSDERWRQIPDLKNNRVVTLTDLDIEIIRRIRSKNYPNLSFKPDEIFVEFDPVDSIHPVSRDPPRKASFLPSRSETKKIVRLVKLIRSGLLNPELKKGPDVFDVWGDKIAKDEGDGLANITRLQAPKLAAPTHSESYNPPLEYLMSSEEKADWENADPEDRESNYVPQKFDSLRHVPSYSMNILDRFQRLLDLYLAPRGLKQRMNVDPASLLPTLPKYSGSFPAKVRIVYDPLHITEASSGAMLSLSAQSTRGTWVAGGTSDGYLDIFDVLSSRSFVSLHFRQAVNAIAWHPFLPMIAVASGMYVYVFVMSVVKVDGTEDNEKYVKRVQVDSAEALGDSITPESSSSWNGVAVAAARTALSKAAAHESWCLFSKLRDAQDGVVTSLCDKGWEHGIRIDHSSPVRQLTWHRKGNNLCAVSPAAASSSEQCAIHCINKSVTVRPLRKSTDGRIRSACFHPTKPWFIVAYYKGVRVFDLKRRQQKDREHKTKGEGLIRHFIGSDQTNCLNMDPTGNHIIVGGDNRRLLWFDLDLNDRPFKILRCHQTGIIDCGFHKKLPLMFTSASDGTARIFHVKIYNDFLQSPSIVPLKTLKNPVAGTGSAFAKCAWHPTQPWLFCTGADGKLRLWS